MAARVPRQSARLRTMTAEMSYCWLVKPGLLHLVVHEADRDEPEHAEEDNEACEDAD